MGIGAYDGKHNGAHCYIIDKDGEFHFSDEVFHVQPNPFVDSGFEEKIVHFTWPSSYLFKVDLGLISSHD